VPIAEDRDLVAFKLLVAADAQVVTAFLGCCGRAIALNDRDVQAIILVKFEHQAFENGIKTAIRLPSPKGAIDARVVDLRMAPSILFDRQILIGSPGRPNAKCS
jgi:hypothetical protein